MGNFKEFCFNAHASINHTYGDGLPYSFHLQMVANICQKFQDRRNYIEWNVPFEFYLNACYGHDLLEDTRLTYNDVKKAIEDNATEYSPYFNFPLEIIYALTNDKGRNRKERAGEAYYKGIRKTPGAVFIKLCDRIANVKFSAFSNSRMISMYKKENEEFLASLGLRDISKEHLYYDMVVYLEKWLNFDL